MVNQMNWIKVRNYFLAAALVAAFFIAVNIESFQKKTQNDCIKCHIKTNPVMVEEWQQSTMAFSGMECIDCHGNSHNNEKNADKAVLPSIKVCGECHQAQADQFSAGKHGKAEEALYVSAMGKKVKTQFPAVFDRSCAVCHNEICKDGGQCDACHSGHRFSAREAKKPESCLPCHMGNHPQYESYNFSKHGALYKSRGLDGTVPTCTTCHMPDGNHMVKTSWGFFGVRGDEPDKKGAQDQKTVKKAVEMLGPILAPDSFRPNIEQWSQQRESMLQVCAKCHSKSKAQKNLESGDKVVATANSLAAKFIKSAQELKKSKIIDEKEYFWLIRDKMHAQRMSMYINAFHQYPEGVLLEMIHFKRSTMENEKNLNKSNKKDTK